MLSIRKEGTSQDLVLKLTNWAVGAGQREVRSYILRSPPRDVDGITGLRVLYFWVFVWVAFAPRPVSLYTQLDLYRTLYSAVLLQNSIKVSLSFAD